MGKFKHLSLIIISAVFLCTTFAACSKSPDKTGVITIGAVFPLTGEDSDEGLRAYNGLRLAVDEINAGGGVLGKNLDVIVLNDQGDETVVVEQYKKLKEKNIAAIIGSSYSGVSIALAKEAVIDNMPMISTTVTDSELTNSRPNVFRMAYTDDYQARIMAQFAATSLKAKTAAVLYNNNNVTSLNTGTFFKDSFEANGGNVVFIGGYDPDADNFESIFVQFKDNEPDVIFCAEDYDLMAIILDDAYKTGLKNTKFIGTDTWDGLTVHISNANSLSNAYFCNFFSNDDASEITQEFVQKYRDAFNELPLAGSAVAYDTVYVLAEAIKNAGGTEHEKIIEQLTATDLDVVTGHLTYDQNNNPSNDAWIIGFKNAKYATIEKILP